MCVVCCCVFVFKQKTAYEMRISDWSSDVCSSDLRMLSMRITREVTDSGVTGFVVTFDDITQLVTAQRTAAWADVARRIAHEIKNPLTPIQLSAERLRRRYARDKVGDDEQTRRVFDKCTDTIVRHVGDIRRMVDEFSAFARMPAPVFHEENLTDVVRRSVF